MRVNLRTTFQKLRLLPVLVVVAGLGFVLRLGDAYIGMKSLSGSAHAEEIVKEPELKKEESTLAKAQDSVPAPPVEDLKIKDEAIAGADTNIDVSATEDKTEVKSETKKDSEESGTGQKWKDASESDLDESEVKKEVYRDLSLRRQELEHKEKKLGEREALLEAAQKELDKKVKEMEGLRDELKDLLNQQTGQEAARIQSLVKIYSSMKPKDAARIFNTLDTDILMDVISSMPESKSGGIIALMDADRAKALTTLLAEQKKLPDMP